MVFWYTHRSVPTQIVIQQLTAADAETIVKHQTDIGDFHKNGGGRIVGARGPDNTIRTQPTESSNHGS